jgi:hypothetical protein
MSAGLVLTVTLWLSYPSGPLCPSRDAADADLPRYEARHTSEAG